VSSQGKKLMAFSCQCEVERNGFPDLEIRKKDKAKVLQVYRQQQQEEVKIFVRY